MLNDEQRKLVIELLEEYESRLADVKDTPDRLTDWISDQIGLARQIRDSIAVKPPDPELERLLQEEEEIEAYHIFLRETRELAREVNGKPIDVSFQGWRNSPLNTVKRAAT